MPKRGEHIYKRKDGRWEGYYIKNHNTGKFKYGSSSEFVEPLTLQNRFKKILNICKIKNANFHFLRHTFATRCVEVGIDVKSLSEILGHTGVNITLNKYVHPSMEQKLKNINMLSDSLTVNEPS